MARIVGNRIVPDEIITEQDTWRTNMNPQNTWGNYGINTLGNAPFPGLQRFAFPNPADVSGPVRYDGQIPGQGNQEMFYEAPDEGFQFPSIFGALANKLKREPNPVLEAEMAALDRNRGYLDTGEFVQERGDRQSIYDFIKTPQGTETIRVLADKNAPGESLLGSKTYEEQLDKKEEWVRNRLLNNKRVGADILRWYQNRTGTSDRFDDGRLITPKGPDTTGGTTIGDITGGTSGQTTTYGGPPTRSFDPGLARAMGSYNRTAGPMSGSYGPWGGAQGGRAGYANGEFVDEDINIQGPGFDVNENIEMTSGGEGDILEQLVAKYIEAGFPPEQAQAMAMQELQQMVAQSGQGEGIASLV
jgi:hypothetical protein